MASKEEGSYRENLAGAILGEENPSRALNLLLSVNVPLRDKFKVLDFPTILINNSESLDSLKRLTTSLEILEQCGKILLKPDEDRPETWRLIEHSSLTMKGGLHVLKLMGYSELTPEEMAFLEGAQPDFMETLDLVIDIVIARREIEAYMNDCHPNPSEIEQNLLSQRLCTVNIDRMALSARSSQSFQDEIKELIYELDLGSDEYYKDVVKTLAPNDSQTLTIEQRFGGLAIFKQPEQLISTDEDNNLVINDHAMEQICCIDVPLNIVAIYGLYRTGKSFLMNILANQKQGFTIGSRVSSQTKGIWAWCRPHPKNTNEVLLLLDTEGMSDPEKGDADHDNRLLCLTILLSSTMIYNHSGVFNHDSLEKLSFITKMTESIRVVNDTDISDDENEENLRLLTPTFIMCLRDFFLDLNDGEHVFESADEFFESRLQITNQPGREAYDEIRACIRKFFPKRRCFGISHPAVGKKLTKLETLREDELEEDFRTDIIALKGFVYDCEPKVLDAVTKKLADGLVFEAFALTYVKSLNQGNTMTFTKAYEQASVFHNSKVVVTLVQEYRQEIGAITLPVKKKHDLQDKCMEIQKIKMRVFRKQSFPYKLNHFENKAKGKMEVAQKEKMDENTKVVQRVLAVTLETLHESKVRKSLTQGQYDNKFGLTLYMQNIEDMEMAFLEESIDFDPDERQTAFLTYKKNIKGEKLSVEYNSKLREEEERNEKLRTQVKESLTEHFQKQLEVMKQEKERDIELEFERLKNNYNEAMGIETIKQKSFWTRFKLLFCD